MPASFVGHLESPLSTVYAIGELTEEWEEWADTGERIPGTTVLVPITVYVCWDGGGDGEIGNGDITSVTYVGSGISATGWSTSSPKPTTKCTGPSFTGVSSCTTTTLIATQTEQKAWIHDRAINDGITGAEMTLGGAVVPTAIGQALATSMGILYGFSSVWEDIPEPGDVITSNTMTGPNPLGDGNGWLTRTCTVMHSNGFSQGISC